MHKILLFVILLIASNPVLALDCDKASSNTVDVNDCRQVDLNKLDAELNQIYKHVLVKFDKLSKEPPSLAVADKSKLKQELIEAQRLWVKFREKDCGATYTLWSDGTIRGLMYLDCKISKTEQRIKELKAYDEFGN